MLPLKVIQQLIKDSDLFKQVYIGKLDNKMEKSLGIYHRKSSGTPIKALGGLEHTSYGISPISLLIHWNKSFVETEEVAIKLFQFLQSKDSEIQIGDTVVRYLSLAVPEPQDVGTDDSGVYEFVIWIDVIYERK